MEKYLNLLKKVQLFKGLNDQEILSALSCLNANMVTYDKDTIIYHEKDKVKFIGIILSGEIQTQKIDYNGNINIISKLFPKEIIAASACYCTKQTLPFNVVSISFSEILCLDINHLIRPCCNLCSFHNLLIQNIINIIADRNIILAEKINILSNRSTKEKIFTYLYNQSNNTYNKSFTIPLSRKQMAEYLSVNRSALSKTLAHLRDEGYLQFKGNNFILIK